MPKTVKAVKWILAIFTMLLVSYVLTKLLLTLLRKS